MKLASLIGLLAQLSLVSCGVFAQSSFHFGNYNPPTTDAPVFDSQGVRLAGSNYLAELWGGATTDSLAPLVVIFEGNRREIVPFLTDGYFVSGSASLSVPTVPPLGSAWLQVRAWEAKFGSTYEQAQALAMGGYGESPLFFQQGGNPFDLLGAPPRLVGLQSFSLRPEIPEPSALGLLLVGGLLLFWRNRFRR